MLPNVKLTNTLSGQKEEFSPRELGKVSMYACGLTPQDAPHIGHIRGAVVMDIIRRWFEVLGFEVKFVQNFTDIDDKIINRMKQEGITAIEVADKYAAIYEEALNSLNIKPIQFVRVTTNMQDIINMVASLIDKGCAYAVDGDVYYSVTKFKDYGKLSKRNPADLISGSRIEVDERKKDPLDFALWKSAKPGEPSWESPWGLGRPGWHIECSTLSLKFLGNNFDIHAGGTDLIFPHHENEIAQSEAYLGGADFCRYWLHWGAITAGGEKMSKSVGNDAKVNAILAKYTPEAIRLYLLGTSYRSPIDYGLDRLDEAQAGWGRVQRAVSNAQRWLEDKTEVCDRSAADYWERFASAMSDDFNTAQALSVIFEAVSEINRIVGQASVTGNLDNAGELKCHLDVIMKMTAVLGFEIKTELSEETSKLLDGLVQKTITWRAALRERKEFAIADRIRDDLKELGILLEDGPHGTIWRKAEL